MGVAVEEAVVDGSGALTIVSSDDNNDNDVSQTNDGDNNKPSSSAKDYKMMHRVMSQLPPEELEQFGGLPALPSKNDNNDTNTTISNEQLLEFEHKMDQLWQKRQEELQRVQDSVVVDLPKVLEERVKSIKEYLSGNDGGLIKVLDDRRRRAKADNDGNDNIDTEEEVEEGMVTNIMEVLQDLEFQLADVDMARDFHTLGGWPYLLALLDESLHHVDDNNDHEVMVLVDEVRALAATAIGTAVSNLGEFRYWALEDVSSTLNELKTNHTNNNVDDDSEVNNTTALSLLTRVFQQELKERTKAMNGGTMAVVEESSHTTTNNAMAKSRATFKLRAIYGLGSLLRGNPAAQQMFVLGNGPDILVRNVLGTLSRVRGVVTTEQSLSRLDYKFASKVLALGEDIVMDVVLHDEEYIKIDESATDEVKKKKKYADEGVTTANQLVASFTTEAWCDLSLRMLFPPSEVMGETGSRGIKERALSAVRVMAPSCQAYQTGSSVWGVDAVKRVKGEWNREGSGDGLDPVYRKELLDLVDGVLDVLNPL